MHKTPLINELFKQIEGFLKEAKNPILVLLGPTASGKTKLSILLGQKFNAEIISTDSRQIYRGMTIGTDAISVAEQDGVPHHMLEFVDPNTPFTLAEYKQKAEKIIEEIVERGKTPMLVGGTGLYLNALIQQYDVPKVPPNEELRKQLYTEVDQHGAEYLHDQLKNLDPDAAAKIHPNNLRYVVRAIEIAKAGKQKVDAKGTPKYESFLVGLQWPRALLYKRIGQRVDNQLKRGLIDEVKGIMGAIENPAAPAFSSLGCKEIMEYLKGNITLEAAIELVKKNTRNYAKRQLTWFRKIQAIHWLDGQKIEEELKTPY